MRQIPLARTAALLLLFFARPALADNPYAEFRVPDSQGFRWLLNGDFNRNSGVFSSVSGVSRDASYAPNVRTELSWFRDTESMSRNLSLSSDLSWFRTHRRLVRESFSRVSNEDSQRRDKQRLLSTWNQSWYPGPGRYFVNTSAFVGAVFSQSISTTDQRSVFTIDDSRSGDTNSQHDYGERSTWTLGVGAGRVRSVDGVYDAWDIERRLRANGRLQKPLSPTARARLAQLSYAGGGLSYAHERSSKYYWREIERILREDGALTGESLDAFALGRLFERALPGRPVARLRGVTVMLSASLDADHGHSDFDRSQTFSRFLADTLVSSFSDRQSDRFRTDRDEFLGGIDADFQRPVGHRWQFGVRSSARYGAGRKRSTRFTTLAQAGWSIADRWSATSTIWHFATSSRLDGVGYPPRWSFAWDNSLDYWLEDAWSLSLSYRIRQDQYRLQSPTFIRSDYSRNGFIGLGFTYRPAGRFAMPQLGIAEHLVPGTR